MSVEILNAPVSAEDAHALNRLLGQLSSGAKVRSSREFNAALDQAAQEQGAVVVIRDQCGLIVASASLFVSRTLLASFGHIEDVVVDEEYRGRGFGNELMAFLIRRAKWLELERLDLTSRESHSAAHALYQKLGFQIRDTTCYRLRLASK